MMQIAALLFSTLLFAPLNQDKQNAPKPDLSTPEKAVQSFVAAFNKLDFQVAAQCVVGGRYTPLFNEVRKQLQPMIASLKGQPLLSVRDLKAELKGDDASVTATVIVAEPKPETALPMHHLSYRRDVTQTEKIPLKRAGQDWQIVAYSEKELEQHTQGMPKSVIRTFAGILTMPEVFEKAREKARAISCLSNVKQVSLGAMMFVLDYDEKFALKAAAYKKSIMPYIKNEGVFHCPSDKSGAISYSFNANLQGGSLGKVPRPAETVMIYEGKNQTLTFRHDGKAAIGFVDGHAKLVSKEGAKSLRWKP